MPGMRIDEQECPFLSIELDQRFLSMLRVFASIKICAND